MLCCPTMTGMLALHACSFSSKVRAAVCDDACMRIWLAGGCCQTKRSSKRLPGSASTRRTRTCPLPGRWFGHLSARANCVTARWCPKPCVWCSSGRPSEGGCRRWTLKSAGDATLPCTSAGNLLAEHPELAVNISLSTMMTLPVTQNLHACAAVCAEVRAQDHGQKLGRVRRRGEGTVTRQDPGRAAGTLPSERLSVSHLLGMHC